MESPDKTREVALDSYSVPTPVEARRKYAEYVQQRITVEWFNLLSSESELTHE